jgi:tetratricopeptide (TPR) repeat protein
MTLSPMAAALVTVAAAVLAIACLYTEYYPVLDGRRALAEALYRLDQRQYRDAEPRTVAAAKADSLSPDPWRLLAELRLGRWEATGNEKDWQSFVEVANTFNRLDPRHHLAWYTRGKWFLTAWRKSQRKEDLDDAISAFSKASERYPNRALLHAQLAWALHLAGEDGAARQEAEQAWQLDQQMPHKEQKLARQHVLDPQLSEGRVKEFRDESAEQTVESLRNASAENPQ